MVRPSPLALLLVAACGGAPPRPGIAPRHALLITVEGLRADHCSAYLYHRDTTTFPVDAEMRAAGRALTVDELARAGTLFTQAFAPSGHPYDSLGALHTGRAPDPTLPPGPGQSFVGDLGGTTLAEAFDAAGFETTAFVSFLQVHPGLVSNLSRGFARFEQNETDRDTLGQAIGYLSARDWGDGRGLFLWIHLRRPTHPFEPETLSNHLQQTIDYAALYTDPAFEGDVSDAHERVASGEQLAPADLQHLTDLYDGELALTNYLLFYFLDFYRYNGNTSAAWDSTLTVLAGTNGIELGDRFGTGSALRDSSLRVPLLLRHPDSLTGSRIFAEIVTLSDVAPTLADWFDLELAGSDGRSLLAVTDSYVAREFDRRPALAASALPGRERVSLRTNDWRLVADRSRVDGGAGEVELYRVERMFELDPDLADQREDVVDELLGTLRARLDRGGAQ